MKTVAVLLANGFEEVEAVTPIDYLRRAGLEVIVAGVPERDVTGARGLRVDTDMPFDELPGQLDGLVIPGGQPGSNNLAANDEVIKLIQKVAGGGAIVGAICAAPAVVLGKAGLLAGKAFTCYPGLEQKVPEGKFRAEAVVQDGTIITSRSAGTAGAFAIALVKALTDEATANKVASAVLLGV